MYKNIKQSLWKNADLQHFMTLWYSSYQCWSAGLFRCGVCLFFYVPSWDVKVK